MKCFTDYPIFELGDNEGVIAPIRECELLSYDGDKYVTVQVGGVITSFKSGYLYAKKGRCGEVKSLPRRTLLEYEGRAALAQGGGDE